MSDDFSPDIAEDNAVDLVEDGTGGSYEADTPEQDLEKKLFNLSQGDRDVEENTGHRAPGSNESKKQQEKTKRSKMAAHFMLAAQAVAEKVAKLNKQISHLQMMIAQLDIEIGRLEQEQSEAQRYAEAFGRGENPPLTEAAEKMLGDYESLFGAVDRDNLDDMSDAFKFIAHEKDGAIVDKTNEKGEKERELEDLINQRQLLLDDYEKQGGDPQDVLGRADRINGGAATNILDDSDLSIKQRHVGATVKDEKDSENAYETTALEAGGFDLFDSGSIEDADSFADSLSGDSSTFKPFEDAKEKEEKQPDRPNSVVVKPEVNPHVPGV